MCREVPQGPPQRGVGSFARTHDLDQLLNQAMMFERLWSAFPLVIPPDNSKVFVADTGEEKISAARMATRQLLAHIEIGTLPTALLVKPDGGEIFAMPRSRPPWSS